MVEFFLKASFYKAIISVFLPFFILLWVILEAAYTVNHSFKQKQNGSPLKTMVILNLYQFSVLHFFDKLQVWVSCDYYIISLGARSVSSTHSRTMWGPGTMARPNILHNGKNSSEQLKYRLRDSVMRFSTPSFWLKDSTWAHRNRLKQFRELFRFCDWSTVGPQESSFLPVDLCMHLIL